MKNNYDHSPKVVDAIGACRLTFTEMSRNLKLPPHVREILNRGEELVTRLVTELDRVRVSQVKHIDELEKLRKKNEERIVDLEAQLDALEGAL